MESRINSLVPEKKIVGIFIGIALDLYINVGIIGTFVMLTHPTQ